MTDPAHPVGLKGLAHVCYHVADLERTVAFYCGLLGLREAFDYRDGESRIGVYLYAGGRGFIEFYQRPCADHAQPGSYQHLCLEVADVDAAVAALRDSGVDVTDPRLGTDQSYQVWLSDPDGNRIELHAYQPDSKQTKAIDRFDGA